MPIISSISAGARAFGLYVLTALASVIDTFNRSDNASDLGSAGGQKWKIWRGVWGIATNKATSTTAASSYPLATLTFTKESMNISVGGPDPGLGAAFWVTDDNNWYATTYDQVYSCQTCSGCAAYNTPVCCAFNTTPGTYASGGTCCAWNTIIGNQTGGGNCCAYNTSGGNYASGGNYYQGGNSFCCAWNKSGGNYYQGGNCIPKTTPPIGFCSGVYNPTYYNPITYPCASNCTNPTYYNPIVKNPITYACSGTCYNPITRNPTTYACSGNCYNPIVSNPTTYSCSGNCYSTSCSSPFTYQCNCSTSHKINFIKMVSSSVSTIASTTFNAAILSFKAILSGNSITIKAYSDSNWTNQIGSDWINTETSPTKTKRHGIIKSPANYAQGSSIDEFGAS